MPDLVHLLTRPRPPDDLLALGERAVFRPAPDVADWIQAAYVAPDGPLHYAGHAHLESARLGVLWTTAENVRHQRRVVGQAEIPLGGNPGSAWRRGRQEQQLVEWFGGVPDFLITLDAFHCDGIDDAEFAALVDHELCHCAQATDEFGSPKFDRETGEPKWAIRGHDVEEFVSVVERFGIQAAGQRAVDLVIAAAQPPRIARVRIAQACGTCLARAA